MRRCMILFGRGWACVLRGNISRNTGVVGGVYDRCVAYGAPGWHIRTGPWSLE